MCRISHFLFGPTKNTHCLQVRFTTFSHRAFDASRSAICSVTVSCRCEHHDVSAKRECTNDALTNIEDRNLLDDVCFGFDTGAASDHSLVIFHCRFSKSRHINHYRFGFCGVDGKRYLCGDVTFARTSGLLLLICTATSVVWYCVVCGQETRAAKTLTRFEIPNCWSCVDADSTGSAVGSF